MVRTLLLLLVGLSLVAPPLSAQVDDKPKTGSEKQASDEKTQEQAEEKPKTPAESVTALIAARKLDEASAALDAALKDAPDDRRLASMRRTLASAYARVRNYGAAGDQTRKMFDSQLETIDSAMSQAQIGTTLMMLRSYYLRSDRENDALKAIDEADERLSSLDTSDLRLRRTLQAVRNIKAQSLAAVGDRESAIDLLRHEAEQAARVHEADADNVLAVGLRATSLLNLVRVLPAGEERNELFKEHQAFVKARILKAQEDGSRDDAVLVGQFMNAGTSQVASMYRDDPDAAEALIETLRKASEQFRSGNEKLASQLARSERSLESYTARIAAARKLLEMVGQPVPELDAAAWVATDGPVEMTGKVVLLDFWAVWCGPCIATFPHLRHLHEEYGPQGLEIVGVTRYYNYAWDEEADRAVRKDKTNDPVAAEVEHEALTRFLASHELEHGTIVVPDGSEMHQAFGVTGIPHAVVIDQKGIVRLIKVGSGTANAEAIEAMIKELLEASE